MRILVVLVLLFLLCGCYNPCSESLQKLPLDVAGVSGDTLVMNGGGNRVVLRKDSGVAIVNGVAIQLGGKISCDTDGIWSVPDGTVEHILLPVLTGTPRKIKTILLDPGHGGHDAGAVSASGIKEKDLNLALAKVIGTELQRMGYTVYLTRKDDKFISLDERPAMIKRIDADLFISVHHNASATNFNAAGMETFVLRSETAPERQLCSETLRCAYLIQAKQQPVNPAHGRGVKFARFKVLRLASCPALLIEAGFLSNPAEAQRCADPEYQRRLGRAIAQAVGAFAAGK